MVVLVTNFYVETYNFIYIKEYAQICRILRCFHNKLSALICSFQSEETWRNKFFVDKNINSIVNKFLIWYKVFIFVDPNIVRYYKIL